MSYCTRATSKDGKCIGNQAVCSGSPVCWEEEVDMYEMYPVSVYADKAIEWLAKADTKTRAEQHKAASTYVEGAKVYAMLAEVARKREEEK